MRRHCHLDQALEPQITLMRPQIAQMNRRFSLIATVVFTVATTAGLPAQTVRGTVVDSATAQPLGSVSIELVDTASQVVARGSTDESGTFLLQALEPGTYHLRVQRIGYQVLESEVALGTRGDVTVPIRLNAVPVPLAPVSVEAARNQYLLDHGFYGRRESEVGTFLDPATVEKLATKAKLATDILTHIPGLRIYQGAPRIRNCQTYSSDDTGPFAPRVYIDGVSAGKEIMWSLQPNDILAVEVYKGPAEIPLLYGGTSTPCGVILIWTKH